ncbi:MAG: class I SAM-dependent methyltransferase [Planctomycetes bacterium]|nr:class I SAM-dependent methyltransferase [Planctomycetota bacterium]
MKEQTELKINPILCLESQPFFVGPVPIDADIKIPQSLPFSLGIHPYYAIPVLIVTEEIRSELAAAYARGSMASTPLGISSLSSSRMMETLKKLLQIFSGEIKGKAFLEIGCGTGDLLNELKIRGADVTGVEIGPQGQAGANKYRFRVFDQPFTRGLIDEKFDCIFSYGCLEHIIDLDELFYASRECLRDGGLFFHSVPNSDLHFRLGTSDHLAHEHVNYFTPQNATRLFEMQGFASAGFSISRAGNEMCIWGAYDPTIQPSWPGEEMDHVIREAEKLRQHKELLITKRERILSKLHDMYSINRSIGFYAGGFDFSLLLPDTSKIRYFDGDPYNHGKSWLVGLPPIESPCQLSNSPVDQLVIWKGHYFEDIVKTLKEDIHVSDDMIIHNIDNWV